MNLFIIVLLLLFFIYFSIRHTWWRKNISMDQPRILTYHMISKHKPKKSSKFNRLRVPPCEFEKQLKWLKKNNWHVVTMSELIENKNNLPLKTVALTFDDGYEDNYLNAFPVLKKYNMKATLYLVVDRFEKNWATDKDLNESSEELNNEPMLKDEQIREMLDSGLVEIGSHTLNHINLKKCSAEEKRNEIVNSKEKIEELYHTKCVSFCYPFGFFEKDDWQIVKDAGYSNATTVKSQIVDIATQNLFLLPRVMISGRQKLFDFILKMKKGRNR